jgi:hypothetical protein
VDQQGVARMVVKAADFQMEKALSSGGDTTIRLTQGADVVSIVLQHAAIEVQRGGRTIRVSPQTAKVEDAEQIRAMLLGSAAVRSFRALSANIENREPTGQEGPLLQAALIDGAIVSMLDGDEGAMSRILKRLNAARKATLHQARFRPAFDDCIGMYEAALLYTQDQFDSCYVSAGDNPSWYWSYWLMKLCYYEQFVRAEQYIFQFISCFTINF